jgi:tetratricopeptide (TPR) repeat protein
LRRRTPIVAAALLLAALAGYVASRRGATPRIVGRSGRPGVAVLPFENHSGSSELAWLSKGLPTMILTGLAQTPGLDVISPRRIEEESKLAGLRETDRADKAQLSEMARRTGAGALVSGSIFKLGAETRIDVQVEEIATGRIIAAETVRGTDMFPLIDELTGRIRSALRLQADQGDRSIAKLTSGSLDAYRLYIEGIEAMDNFRMAQARQLLEKATEVDPTFGIAYSALAQVAMLNRDNASSATYEAKALEHLDRLPEREQLLVRGRVARRAGRLDEAERLLERLVSQYPDAEDGYHYLAHVYDDGNDRAKSVAVCERAVQAVPAAAVIRNECGYVFLNSGRHPEAIEQFREYLRLRPLEANAHDSLAEAYLIAGDPERAIAGFSRALEIDPTFSTSLRGRAFAYGTLGQYDAALRDSHRATDALLKESLPPTFSRFVTAAVLSRVGRYREAQKSIERGVSDTEAVNNMAMRANFHLLASWLSLEKEEYARGITNAMTAGRLIPQLTDPARRRVQFLVPVLAGVAEARAGHLDRAQTHLNGVRAVFDRTVAQENWWVRSLEGEIALARGDLTAAKSAFAAGEPPQKSFFGLGAEHTLFSNQLPFRDGRARVEARAGDLRAAIALYRALLAPGPGQKWTAMLEPRYVLQLARLLEKDGDTGGARAEYRRFTELWKDADADLPELHEARQKIAR